MEAIPDFRGMCVTIDVMPHDDFEGALIPEQSHSGAVKWVVNAQSDRTVCDALVTDIANLSLGVHTRDCAPVCFSDGARVAIAHVGWRGFTKDIIEHVYDELGMDIEVFVGPFLHAFEVQKDECYDALRVKCGERFFTVSDERYIFHFKDAIASFLPQGAVFDPRNTATDASLPSHRHKRPFGHIITTVSRKRDETQ